MGTRPCFKVVEEAIMNPENKYFRGGRIEVYDNKDKGGYACYEARFFIPKEFMDSSEKCGILKNLTRCPLFIGIIPMH